jgi:ectoine hydroxylase-related dioxygenase (phytanoyl-CoA dioxygenase family)
MEMEITQLTAHAEVIRKHGYTVIPNYLDTKTLEGVRRRLDAVFRRESGWAAHNQYLQTATHQMSHLLLLKDPFFLRLAIHKPLVALMQELLGKDCQLSCMNGFTTKPQGEGQPLHLDQAESTPGTLVLINALHVIDDFTKENGATRLIPGSHLEWCPRQPEDPVLEEKAIQIEAPAGSLLIFSGSLLHAGSKNSTDKPRRALHVAFCRSWVRPGWDFRRSAPRSFTKKLKTYQKELLGYYNRPNWYRAEGYLCHAGMEKYESGFFWKQLWENLKRFCR